MGLEIKMYIKKTMQKKGRTYALVTGIKGNTMLDDIAKKYSKNWNLTAFASPSDKDGLLLVKRKTPLSKPIRWYTWETGKY
jgi:hypothetical protein